MFDAAALIQQAELAQKLLGQQTRRRWASHELAYLESSLGKRQPKAMAEYLDRSLNQVLCRIRQMGYVIANDVRQPLGLTATAGLKPSRLGVVLLSLLAGLAAGAASDLDTPSWQGVIGIAGVMLFVTISALAALADLAHLAWLKTVLPIGRRILGSWIAAIGLLLGALAIRTGSGF